MLDCQINLVPLYYDKGRNHSIFAGPAEGLQQPDNSKRLHVCVNP